MDINANDIHYECDTKGYMLYYKDEPIGGAGIDKYTKGCRSNLKLFKEAAAYDKRRILSGYGGKRYMDYIEAINKRSVSK